MKKTLLASLFFALALSACPGGEPPRTGPGTVFGLVTDSATGARLQGVQVEVAGHKATTNEKGEFTLDNLPEEEAVLHFTLAEYAPGFENVKVTAEGEGVLVTLKKQGALQDYDRTKEGTLYTTTEAGPYAVFFQPDTLDTGDTALRVAVTPVDPTKEAAVLPGRLVTESAMLVPLTFAEFSIYDSQGRHVNLKAGSEAIVELPVPPDLRGLSQYAEGSTIHCYSYNPQTGQWEDFVVGTVVKSSIDGATPVVRASIKHFSWYGAAPETNDCIDVVVKVLGPDGQPMKGARVEAFPGGSAVTDANGLATVVTAQGGETSYVATRTYTDTDGSVSGMPGARVIDFGKVQETVVGLVPRACNGSGLSGAQATTTRGTAEDPLVVTLAPVGELSYQVTAYLAGQEGSDRGSIMVILDQLLPDGTSAGAVEGAVMQVSGAGETVQVTDSPTLPGYYAGEVRFVPGERYTLSIDVNNDGSVEGTGSVVAVGAVSWASPTEGQSLSASNFTARWQLDSASGGSIPGILSYVSFAREEADGSAPVVSFFMGTTTEYTPYKLNLFGLSSTERLDPGTYHGAVSVFSGPYSGMAGLMDVTVTNNITGPFMGGQFYCFGGSAEVSFTLTP